ncbi:MAG TPA: flavodoxin domain-containing protein [Aliidongia sp.]|uniref:flavodoxin domain-containing protein n=1 Tax=Aliidongia sp. TaxID=1914230 RepID=UPI002DDC9A9B|nr:flavodoxin domain-containing protein [Aliidongia sp.]HEV2674796.1 flavodoxin domain-containing protein [Aliidongia sp.]
MTVDITILVGTMTGTAEIVAEEVQAALEAAGHSAAIAAMDSLDAHVFDRGSAFLIVTSTYGAGDVPDNAQSFFAAIEGGRPALSHVSFGVIALGDRTYKGTYCEGGLKFGRLLSELGARRIGEPMLHDASAGTMPEEIAAEWVVGWVEDHLAPALKAA